MIKKRIYEVKNTFLIGNMIHFGLVSYLIKQGGDKNGNKNS